jgi:SAM-dependent MidA family methyltransferase
MAFKNISVGDLRDIIIDNICQHGPISFESFMESALYHPCIGYYSSSGERIGIDGDYFTSPSLSPVFGELVSSQLKEMWELLGRKNFTVVEYGAGDGCLCRDILKALEKDVHFYDELEYIIIEKSPAMRQKQKQILHEKVRWVERIQDLPPISGCILSNELVDNFAVHAVEMQDELMEIFIGYNQDLHEILRPASTELKDYFAEQDISLPMGFRTEANLQAIQWINSIAEAIREGFVITIDYGGTSAELYDIRRKKGSILCYHRHRINEKPLINIGEQDITAHVNFSALNFWGRRNNLELTGYTSQSHFLRATGIMKKFREIESQENWKPDQMIRLKTIFFDMGEKIKCLVQHKGIKKAYLTGLQFPLPL